MVFVVLQGCYPNTAKVCLFPACALLPPPSPSPHPSLQTAPPSLPRDEAPTELVPLPAFKTQCGPGHGLAVCPALGLLVTSDSKENTLSVWGVPGGASGGGGTTGGAGASAGAGAGGASAGGGDGGLRLVCTLGGDGSAAPMQFTFADGYYSGYLAFTPHTTTTTSGSSSTSSGHPLLLVTDAGHDAVHALDVVGRTHVGYLATPGSIAGPRGVAASGASPLVAVSAWKDRDSGDHVVVVYRGSGAVWEAVRVIGGGFGYPGSGDGQLKAPYGLRLSGDGSRIWVADLYNGRVSVFRVGGGGFVRHIATELRGPMDVEVVKGCWLVACGGSNTVEFVGDGDGDGGRSSLGKAGGGAGRRDGEFDFPSALAFVPGLGLAVREWYNERLQVFSTPDIVRMASMSDSRVAWMVAVARLVLRNITFVAAPYGGNMPSGRPGGDGSQA
jgi:hypothetical protein